MHGCIRVAPSAIEIYTSQRRPGIANHHAIWIDHWYQFDDVVMQYLVILFVILWELFQNMAHYEATMCFCSMKPGLDIHTWLPSMLQRPCLSSFGDGYLVDVQPSNTLSYCFLSIKQVLGRDFKIVVCLVLFFVFEMLMSFLYQSRFLLELILELGRFAFKLLFGNPSDLLMLNVKLCYLLLWILFAANFHAGLLLLQPSSALKVLLTIFLIYGSRQYWW